MNLPELERSVTRNGLQAWHAASDYADSNPDGTPITLMQDKSINGRDLICDSSEPTFQTDIINGHPAIEFSGSNNPLYWSGALLTKHVFIIAAYADAAFPAVSGAGEYAGLVSGIDDTNINILVGNPSSTKFFDNNFEGSGDYVYRRRDVQFAENDLQASFNNAISIFEVSHSVGFSLDGIQIGRDRERTTRKWKGYVCEDLFFSRVLSYAERHDIYAYLAMKYWLWRRVASGLDVWPFQPEWGQPSALSKTVLSSRSVSGAFKGRSKGTKKLGIQPQFEARMPEEYDAAVEFCDTKYPGTSFIYRDDAYSPARDTEMLFLSEIQQQAANFRDINYTFQAQQV